MLGEDKEEKMCQGMTRRTKCAKGGRPPKSRTVVIHLQARAYLINIRTLSKITDLIRLTSDHIKDNPHQQYSLAQKFYQTKQVL